MSKDLSESQLHEQQELNLKAVQSVGKIIAIAGLPNFILRVIKVILR